VEALFITIQNHMNNSATYIPACLSQAYNLILQEQGEEKLTYIYVILGGKPNGISPSMLFELTSLKKQNLEINK